MIDERKNVQTTPTRTYCKRSKPLPYSTPNEDAPALEAYPAPSHHPTTPGCLDVFTFIYLLFLPFFGRRHDIDWNTVSKDLKTQNNQPANRRLKWDIDISQCPSSVRGGRVVRKSWVNF